MTDKEKIRKEIQRLQDLTMDENKNFYSEAAEGEYNALCNIEHFIDSLQEESEPQFKVGDTIRSKVWDRAVHEIVSMDDSAYCFENGGMVRFDDQEQWELAEEPVSKVWHDANEEQPEEHRTVVVWNPITMDGGVLTRCTEVYKGRIWAYIEDLLNLFNVQRTVKNWKEPVSEDLGKAANEWDIKVSFTPFYMTLDDNGNPNGVRRNYTTHAESFKAGAKWQEQQMMSKAINAQCFGFQGAALFSFRLPADNYLVGSEIKVIVIKED